MMQRRNEDRRAEASPLRPCRDRRRERQRAGQVVVVEQVMFAELRRRCAEAFGLLAHL